MQYGYLFSARNGAAVLVLAVFSYFTLFFFPGIHACECVHLIKAKPRNNVVWKKKKKSNESLA